VQRVGKEVLSVDASNVAIDLTTEAVFVLTVHHLKKIRATLEPFALASCSS
jgi:hypothetical protein